MAANCLEGSRKWIVLRSWYSAMQPSLFDKVLNRVCLVGRSELPDRQLALHFDFPAQSKSNQFSPELRLRSLQAELRVHENMPLSQLEFVIEQLTRLTNFKLSTRKRYKILELIGAETASLIRGVYVQYRDELAVAEGEGRKRNLDKLLEAVRLLIVGYLNVFQSLIVLPDYRYRGQRRRVRQVGLRILELIYVEQRICALLYQFFPPQRWRDFNQVFFFLRLYESDTELQPLMICLPSHLRGQDLSKCKGQKMSPKQLYITVQLFGLVDCYTWPSGFVQVLDNYIKLFEPEIPITADAGVELKSGHLLTFFNGDRPPRYRRAGSQGVGSLIDISTLKRKISEDYATLYSLDEEQAILEISPPLSVLEKNQRLVFIEMLQHKLQPRQRRDNREVIDAYRDFTIISGFMNCYKQLTKSVKKTSANKDVLQQSLDDMLAGRSSSLADDSRDVKHGEWFVVNDSKGGVLVRTKETRYLVSMAVGELALFNQLDDPEGPLQLGYISRFVRLGQGDISVTLQKLSSQLESVVLQNAAMHKSGEAVPSFLIRVLRGMDWQLLVPAKYTSQLNSGSLFMRRSGRLFSVEVTQVAQRQQDYTLLDIKSGKSKKSV